MNRSITISWTVSSGLCTGCGVCKAICPKACIQWTRRDGMFFPEIDAVACVGCGLCASVCPGLGHTYEAAPDAVAAITGPVLDCRNAWSRDPETRHRSASGGVVTTLVSALLAQGLYDGVFCLDSYDYRQQLSPRLYNAENFPSAENTSKSRYLPVSQESTLAYIRKNPKARLILIGSPCCLRGLDAAIRNLRRNREQYLFIGLFCDKIFTYNVLPYFEDTLCQGKKLAALHFKNKESGGWPGDMKLFPQGAEPLYASSQERQKAKAWFMPERCLYCVDKLNAIADISLGDNYTKLHDSPLGSNSVILRTPQGLDAWQAAKDCLEAFPIPIEQIQQAQDLRWRLNNLYYGDLKARQLKTGLDLNRNVPREENFRIFDSRWHDLKKEIAVGRSYSDNPAKALQKIRRGSRTPSRLESVCRRAWYLVKRMLY